MSKVHFFHAQNTRHEVVSYLVFGLGFTRSKPSEQSKGLIGVLTLGIGTRVNFPMLWPVGLLKPEVKKTLPKNIYPHPTEENVIYQFTQSLL